MKAIVILVLLIALAMVWVYSIERSPRQIETPVERPKYLYKILSLDDWRASDNKTTIHLSSFDKDFIHLATEDQLPRF